MRVKVFCQRDAGVFVPTSKALKSKPSCETFKNQVVKEAIFTRGKKEIFLTVLETVEAAAAPWRRGASDALVRHIDWMSYLATQRRVACRKWEHA
jgi:hypothetical protein